MLAELTLALLLFSDASRVNISELKRDIYFPTRRRALNVESGLNDGIATPIVVFALAVAASELGSSGHEASAEDRRCWSSPSASAWASRWGSAAPVSSHLAPGGGGSWPAAGGLATLAAALTSFALSVALDGNGFIAAFVAGIAFGAFLPADVADVEEVGEFPELLGELLALAVWFLFGAALVPLALDYLSVSTLVYALLSLTVIRMVPVALSLLGTGLDRPTVMFVGRFGPRGLASVVFALLAVEELGESPLVGQAAGVVALTVFLSVVLHGVSAGPLESRYVHEQREVDPAAAPRSRRMRRRVTAERLVR